MNFYIITTFSCVLQPQTFLELPLGDASLKANSSLTTKSMSCLIRTRADAHYLLWCSVLKKENFNHSLGSKSPISGEICENSSWCMFFSQYMYPCLIGKVEGSPFFSITAGASCVRRTGSPCACVCVCVEPVCFLFWVAGSLREQHSKVTAMRSSACVVMATKAVAALLRNKMAGMVVSLSLLLLLLTTPPLLSSFFLVSVNWSRLVVTPSTPLPAPHPALTLFCSLFYPPPQPSIHTPRMWVSTSRLRAEELSLLDVIRVMLLGFFGAPHS